MVVTVFHSYNIVPSQFPIEQKDWEAHRTAVGSFYLSSGNNICDVFL